MKTVESKLIHGFLRQEEMNDLIASEKDPITADLMSHLRGEPIASFADSNH
jgi:hypothetical protein